MASTGYPKIPSKAWRTLRARAAAAPSTRFTPSSIAALLGMASPESARTNVVRPLRTVGLIDDDGALTDRGNMWRLDPTYGDACQEILDEIYPGELTLLSNDDGSPDTQAVRTWFDHKGFGESNAQQMAATYTMIASKEVPEAPTGEPKAGAKKSTPKSTQEKNGKARTARPEGEAAVTSTPPPSPGTASTGGPNIHLDIQVHIPADASPEQIEAIFASMAKHLYNR
jgi:hypothetical protein